MGDNRRRSKHEAEIRSILQRLNRPHIVCAHIFVRALNLFDILGIASIETEAFSNASGK